ncbi:MAG: hypothetical protein HUJ52_03840, partial [Malacoplasma sp.]|nr:hypothetical protein [Malacoplasma sp.]
FFNSPTATYDYFGVDDEEGGVQWAVNALWLTKGGERLPYILFRDTNGVHLCGLYGAWAYDENGDIKKGFLADNKYDETKFGQPWSQGRQNIMLKALNLFMKYRNESLFDISSEVKTYFTSNVDDIVIKMAIDKVNRKGEAQSTDPIFKLSDVLGGVTEDSFKKILSDSTVFFLLQNTLATYEEANKKIFNLESAYVTNSLLSRSNNTTLKNKTSDNYKNALATIAPYDVVYSNINPETDLYKAKITYDVTTLCNWISVTESESGEYSELQKLNEDVFIESTGVDTEVMTQQIESGIKNLDDEWNNIIENVLDIHSATKPNSEYGKWSEHLNPEYKYNKDKASDAVQNGLYMALNKYLEGTEISNGIKIDASKAYATKGDNSIVKKDAEGDPEIDEYGIATLDDTDTKYPGLTDAVASLHNTSKVFTSETPLSYYTNATTTMTQSKYTEMVNNLANQSIIANTSSNVASDDLATYWNFLDTIQYLVSDNYAKLMEYLQTSVMSYGVEADLVWLVQDDRNA